MSETLEVQVIIKKDGETLAGFPIVRRIVVDLSEVIVFEDASGGGYAGIPGEGNFTTVNLLFLKGDQNITVRLAGQTDQGATINANGFMLLVDCDIGNLAALDNSSGKDVKVKAILGGT